MSTTGEPSAVELYAEGALSVRDACAEYGISRSVVYVLMQSGGLPYSQLGRRRCIGRRALAELLAKSVVGFTPQTAGAK